MKPLLHVLLIDDSPEDAELIVLELKKEFDPVFNRVEQKSALEEALHEKSWDIIVADFVMPHFSGLEALKTVQQHNLDIPFIIVSGNVGEEVAVEAMKAGAHDYLIKNRLTRLVPAVKREIREAAIRRERRQAEEALHSSQVMFRSLVEQSLVGIYIYQDGAFIYANPKCASIFGYTQNQIVSGKTFFDLVSADHRDIIAEKLAVLDTSPHGSVQFQFRGTTSAGATIELEAHSTKMSFNGKPAIIGTILDITERKLSEEKLRQSQKLEAIGRLAGGISHDFNNLLTVINGYSTLVLRSLEPDSPLTKEVEFILHAGERAAELTRQLLTFSRRQIVEPRILQVNDLVLNLQKMLCRLLGEQYHLSTRLAEALGMTKADPGQVEQIIMNLVVNARDALPNGGDITIETGNTALDADPEKPYIFISVIDTGTGMTDDVKSRAFEPFFTTKPQGQGTGLGLATVYGIVQQSGGTISISTERGKGTCFTVYLPRVFEDSAYHPTSPQIILSHQKHTILVVEDDLNVLNLVATTLAGNGYEVVCASNPTEAVDVFNRHRKDIHLLLTDIALPGMNGLQLAELLMTTKPELNVLFMSGHLDESSLNTNIFKNEHYFIAKPFVTSTLLDKIARVISANPGGTEDTGEGDASRNR